MVEECLPCSVPGTGYVCFPLFRSGSVSCVFYDLQMLCWCWECRIWDITLVLWEEEGTPFRSPCYEIQAQWVPSATSAERRATGVKIPPLPTCTVRTIRQKDITYKKYRVLHTLTTIKNDDKKRAQCQVFLYGQIQCLYRDLLYKH